MKDMMIKVVRNRETVNAILSAVEETSLASGQILITSQMLADIIKVISDGKFEVSNICMLQGGALGLDLKTKNGMALRYSFRISAAVVSRGQLILKAKYTEEKLSGGIGSALLNFSGKSGLAFALGKVDGIHVDSTNIEINKRGIPDFIDISFRRATPGGLVFSIN